MRWRSFTIMDKMMETYKRDASLDSMKMLAALMVVFQHAIGKGAFSGYVLALSRIAVPLFMMISGLLYIDVVNRNRERKQIIKFLRIALEMTVVYFAIDFLKNLIRGTAVDYIRSITNPQDMIRFIIYNDPTVADHGWYMWAMIYTLILVLLIPAVYQNKKIEYALIILGTAASLIFGKYSLAIFGKDILPAYTRNAWTIGIPCFLCGMILREKINAIHALEQRIVVFSTITLGLACMVERALLIRYDVNGTRDSYIFLIPFAISFFIFIYKNPFLKKDNILSVCGKEYSLILFVIHPLFVIVEYAVFNMESAWQYVGFMVVLLFSMISTVIIRFIQKNIHRLVRKSGRCLS